MEFDVWIAAGDDCLYVASVERIDKAACRLHGRDGVRRWQEDLAEAWGDEIRVEPEAYFDAGEQTLLFHVLRGRGQHSGVEVALPGAGLFGWSDGLIVHLKAYAHREDVLTDLRVSLGELKPIEP